MTAASANRLRTVRTGTTLNLGVKAAAVIFQGCMVMSLAGVAVAARAAVSRAELDTIRVVGLANAAATGGGSDGAVKIDVDTGVFRLSNSSSGDAIAGTDIGKLCFVADDQTVAKTSGGGVRPIAGRIVDVDSLGVWVDFAFAREPRRLVLPFAINETDTLAGTSAELVSPVDGAITELEVIVQKAVTTGGDVTASVGTTAVDGLACTIADAATKGTIVADTPTAGHATTVVAKGGRIQVTPAAAFATAGAVSGFVEITY